MMSKVGTRAKESGFTLIELLVVMAIIGILGKLTIYNFSEFKQKAAYAVSEQTLRDARIALEAGIAISDSLPAAVNPAVIQNTPGQFNDVNARELLRGFNVPKSVKVQVTYNPSCVLAACTSDFIRVDHCAADDYLFWFRQGNGAESKVENITGANCT